MNQKIKRKWVKALRSGDYKQARETLKKRNGAMCCLGVLCDIQGAEWEYTGNNQGWSDHIYAVKGDTDGAWEDGEPPVTYRAEMTTQEMSRLMCMNDGVPGEDPCSFTEIADYIEANL